jgi:hypothetical protein
MVVEIKDPEFELYKFDKPTGNYAWGRVLSEYETEYIVELLCNYQIHRVSKSICIKITN